MDDVFDVLLDSTCEVVCAMGDKGCTLIVSSLFLLVLDFLKCFSPSPPFFKY